MSLFTELNERTIDEDIECARAQIESATAQNLGEIRQVFLGKKSKIAQLSAAMGKLDAEKKRQVGELLHRARTTITQMISAKQASIDEALLAQKLVKDKIDVSLPVGASLGARHPVMRTRMQMERFFMRAGFDLAHGPEIETDNYNFAALNIAENHPARAMHDTFYLDAKHLLRTHTSPIQVRAMANGAPLAVICAGRVYRCDSDQTHSPMFHQMEGLLINEHTHFGELRGLIFAFLQDFFGKSVQVRFRPSFFPFTEPSVEVDILSQNGRWLEVLGGGMVHPSVLDMAGIDSSRYRGFAFGLGIERFAMLKYGIDDLRLFFQNDAQFLAQFSGEWA